ncbi:FkbM family methyltransferase [Variovorax boronicumulans]|uniref:FkbM family methyltransferase n=1 Tax=Variovorax boronicumulans TaxID=436515 RepID=UPI002787A74C|nr:FkbM family methyltransferase [Variovorax boronicumulans]MDQ0084910.1 FkbM family methyltransferase [Variovorax boronicumulans]
MTQNNSSKAFTSYAQNFEDVMLWRALKHVSAGVYVDIGAQHPVVDSVSKAFYEHGWRGVHIEPVPYYAELLRQDRPDEVVLQLALSDTAGILELNVIEDTGLSTGVKAYADAHQVKHGFAYKTVPTPMLPMKTALASLAGHSVHWLKIDVEGLEEEVLRGWDSKTLRPWIIVIEATVPMSTELHYDGAEHILVDADYQFAYFDGLNRFYVAAEHADLLPALRIPPNVFDYAELSGYSGTWCNGLTARHQESLRSCTAQLEAERAERVQIELTARAELNSVRTALEDAKNRLHEAAMRAVEAEARAAIAEASANHANERALGAEARVLEAEARALRATNTPMRRLASAAMEGRITSGIKRRIKVVLRVAAITVGHHPTLKRMTVFALSCVPPLRRRLQAMLAPPPACPPHNALEKPLSMSPDTTLVYRQLRQSQHRSGRA